MKNFDCLSENVGCLPLKILIMKVSGFFYHIRSFSGLYRLCRKVIEVQKTPVTLFGKRKFIFIESVLLQQRCLDQIGFYTIAKVLESSRHSDDKHMLCQTHENRIVLVTGRTDVGLSKMKTN